MGCPSVKRASRSNTYLSGVFLAASRRHFATPPAISRNYSVAVAANGAKRLAPFESSREIQSRDDFGISSNRVVRANYYAGRI